MEKIFYSTWQTWPKKTLSKLLLTMKITTLFLLVGTLNSFALNSYSQSAVVTLNLKNASVEQVLNEIERNSEFFFLFNQKLVDVSKKVDISAKNAQIKDVLTQLFEGDNISYLVYDRQIILAPKNTVMGVLSQVQQNRVMGSVTDATTGEALPGVNVVVEGTTMGVVTDFDGKFTIDLQTSSAVLVFSYVGYLSQKVAYSGQERLEVKLSPDITKLEEVVVVGYGTLQKKELTSSVTSVSSKDFIEGSTNNALQSINGKVAGLSVSSTAPSDPNAGISLQVRGAASIKGGTGPLVVIDGVPGGDLANIVQQDVESISILKDASSAAIYGTRGANGVIIVTTKKGSRSSDRVNVVYDSYVSTMTVARKPEVLSAEEFLERKRDVDLGARTNWYEELLRKTPIENNQYLSFSSGSQNTSYRASVNYRTAEGIDIATNRKEYGGRLNFSQRALDGKFEFIGNVANRYTDETYTDYGAFNQAMQLNPTMPVRDPNDPNKFFLPYGYDTWNPVAKLTLDQVGAERKFLNADVTFKVNLLKNLSTQVMLAQQVTDRDEHNFTPSTSAESRDNNYKGRAERKYEKWTDRTFEWTSNYSLEKNNHSLKLMAGYSYQDFTTSGMWTKNFDFPSDALSYNALAEGLWLKDGKADMNSWKGKNQLSAIFGRVNYSYNDIYILSASLRREGSSKFGANNKYGLFPAISAGWRISKMNFMQNVVFVNDLKIRGGFGVAGREGFDRYTSAATYSGAGRYMADGAWLRVFGPGNNPNPDLKWERAINYNLGLDFGIFNNRLSGSIDVYQRMSKDMIFDYDAPVPPMIHDRIFVNVGTIQNRGLELNLDYQVVNSQDFSYNINLVGSYNKSIIKSLSNDKYNRPFFDDYDLPSPGNPGRAYRNMEGHEIGSFYGLRYAGVDEMGRFLIYNKKGEKVLSSTKTEEDKAFIGNGIPKIQLSWNNSVRYKNFDLTLYFRGYFKYDILNLKQMYYGLQSVSNVNLLQDAFDRNAAIKSEKELSDYFLEKGDFLKLDVANLGYNMKFKNFRYINNMRVYFAVKNVFTITKYSGLDPAQVEITGFRPGIEDKGGYPTVRTFTLGLKVSL